MEREKKVEEDPIHIVYLSLRETYMTAFKPLVATECGTPNPLIQLSEFYKHDQTLVTQNGILHPSSVNLTNTNLNLSCNAIIDELISEYYKPIAAPSTFHLRSLFKDLRASNRDDGEWSRQFLHSSSNHRSSHLTDNEMLQSIHSQWISENEHNSRPSSTSFVLHPTPSFLHQQPPLINANPDHDTVDAAKNILSFLQESQFVADTECKTFVQHVVDVKSVISPNVVASTHQTEDRNADERECNQTFGNASLPLLDHHTQHSYMLFEPSSSHIHNYTEYKFIPSNHFSDCIKPYEEGLQRLEVHDIVNAILCFEAAVQKEPDHIDAWLHLGVSQSKNEQDARAICALKKCVELDSKYVQAYLTLASCYANEMLINEALDSLHKWLANHDKYACVLSNSRGHSIANNETRAIARLTFEHLRKLFMQAISLANSPNEIDSELQVCLGILFYLYDDYGKAAECFNTAVLVKPNDALLWNKLGAAVANDGHNEQAVHAYYHALTLSPGFIRARYNLGICCLNLNAYRQAIEHFLIALKQQNNETGPRHTHVPMSENIWRTLAIAIHRLKRSDLDECVACKDLYKLFREFEIE